MRVAIYGRFSSDLQGARSITTRSPWRTQHAAKHGWLTPRSSRTPRSRVPLWSNRPGLKVLAIE
jgi:hypothetical protein